MVPGREYRLHQERLAFILKEFSPGHVPQKSLDQDSKIHNLFSNTESPPQQANLHYLTWGWWGVLSKFIYNGDKAKSYQQLSDQVISILLLLVASKGTKILIGPLH